MKSVIKTSPCYGTAKLNDCGASKLAANGDKISLSILIISFNTKQMLLECLNSLLIHGVIENCEILVLDNNSSDGSGDAVAEAFPQIRLVRSEENHGFAVGNNLLAEEARGDLLLLLNPDTIILPGAIQALSSFAIEDGTSNIYGGRTLFPDGSLNPKSCWKAPSLWSVFCIASGIANVFPASAIANPDYMPTWPRNSVRNVDIVSGCFLMLSSANWQRLGGFDNAFRMYGEEFDLCLRAKKLGIRCLVNPDAEIIHYGGASESKRADKMCRLLATKVLLFRRHWRPTSAYIGCQLLKLWAMTRVVGCRTLMLSGRSPDSYGTWLAVWKRRREWSRGQVEVA